MGISDPYPQLSPAGTMAFAWPIQQFPYAIQTGHMETPAQIVTVSYSNCGHCPLASPNDAPAACQPLPIPFPLPSGPSPSFATCWGSKAVGWC